MCYWLLGQDLAVWTDGQQAFEAILAKNIQAKSSFWTGTGEELHFWLTYLPLGMLPWTCKWKAFRWGNFFLGEKATGDTWVRGHGRWQIKSYTWKYHSRIKQKTKCSMTLAWLKETHTIGRGTKFYQWKIIISRIANSSETFLNCWKGVCVYVCMQLFVSGKRPRIQYLKSDKNSKIAWNFPSATEKRLPCSGTVVYLLVSLQLHKTLGRWRVVSSDCKSP